MKFRTITETEIVTPDGTVPLSPGQIVELHKDDAIPMIEAGVITPIATVAYKLHSDILGDSLWVVPDESCAWALRDVTEPIYSAGEVKKLKGLSVEGLRAVH